MSFICYACAFQNIIQLKKNFFHVIYFQHSFVMVWFPFLFLYLELRHFQTNVFPLTFRNEGFCFLYLIWTTLVQLSSYSVSIFELSSRETRRAITMKPLLLYMKNIIYLSELYIRCVSVYLAVIFVELLTKLFGILDRKFTFCFLKIPQNLLIFTYMYSSFRILNSSWLVYLIKQTAGW